MDTNLFGKPSQGGVLLAALAVAVGLATSSSPAAQGVSVKQTTESVRRALERLPYCGVFDFLAFSVERGVVTLSDTHTVAA
jgi:hypothetical protein